MPEVGVVPADLHAEAARAILARALELGRQYGYRNAQVTVLAPTGTIAFMMDCDTTGIEPDIALVKYKQLVGGGHAQDREPHGPGALRNRGYDEDRRRPRSSTTSTSTTRSRARPGCGRGPADLRLRLPGRHGRASAPSTTWGTSA